MTDGPPGARTGIVGRVAVLAAVSLALRAWTLVQMRSGNPLFAEPVLDDAVYVQAAQQLDPGFETYELATVGMNPSGIGYDQGRIPASVLIGSVPFGMEPWEYAAWWREGGGRDLGERLARPVRIANDADCFTLSEAHGGSADEAWVVFGVILGTAATPDPLSFRPVFLRRCGGNQLDRVV